MQMHTENWTDAAPADNALIEELSAGLLDFSDELQESLSYVPKHSISDLRLPPADLLFIRLCLKHGIRNASASPEEKLLFRRALQILRVEEPAPSTISYVDSEGLLVTFRPVTGKLFVDVEHETFAVSALTYNPRHFENQDGTSLGADILEQDTPRVIADVRVLAKQLNVPVKWDSAEDPRRQLPSKTRVVELARTMDFLEGMHVSSMKNVVAHRFRNVLWVISKFRYRIALRRLKSWVRLHDRYRTRMYGCVIQTAMEMAGMLERGVDGVSILEPLHFRVSKKPVFLVLSRYTVDEHNDVTAQLAWYKDKAAYAKEMAYEKAASRQNKKRIDLRRIRGFVFGPALPAFAKIKPTPRAELCLSVIIEKPPHPSRNDAVTSIDFLFDRFADLFHSLSSVQMTVKLRGYNPDCIVLPPGRVLWMRFFFRLREALNFPAESQSISFAQLILHRAIQVGLIVGAKLSTSSFWGSVQS